MALEAIASFMALNKVVHDRAIYGKQYKLTKTCQCIHTRLKRAEYKQRVTRGLARIQCIKTYTEHIKGQQPGKAENQGHALRRDSTVMINIGTNSPSGHNGPGGPNGLTSQGKNYHRSIGRDA